jgi:hypothetical protein
LLCSFDRDCRCIGPAHGVLLSSGDGSMTTFRYAMSALFAKRAIGEMTEKIA